MPAPQLVPTPAKVDALNEPTRARVHLAHLSTQQIEAALRRCGGSLTQAAAQLNVGRTTLYLRTVEEPSLLETRAEIVESLIDTAEGVIVAALARGDVNAATFVLRTQGGRRGWSTWNARHEAEQTPEQPRRKVDMSAALRALSPEELLQLEGIVGKLEADAKSGAGLDAGRDDGSSRRSFRRRHFRGEVSAAVDEVEAVAASGEARAERGG